MTTKQIEGSEKNKPLRVYRSGRFKISVWRFRQLLTNGRDRDSITYLERWTDVQRVCLEYGTYNRSTQTWKNQRIWLDPEDLRSLGDVLDKVDGEGSISPSPPSLPNISQGQERLSDFSPSRVREKIPYEVNTMRRIKMHNTIEYLKLAGFYHDTFDLEDQGVAGILAEYGVNSRFNEEETQALKEDLHELAEQNEFREIARLSEIDPAQKLLEV